MVFATNIYEGCEELVFCLAVWLNAVTFGYFWTIMLLGFCVVLFLATINFGTARAFGFGTIGGVFGAIFLVILTLIPWWIATIFFLAGGLGIVAMVVNER